MPWTAGQKTLHDVQCTSSSSPPLLKQPHPTMLGNSALRHPPATSGMARPQGHGGLACLSLPLLLLLLLPGATTASSYSSLCRTPGPASDLPAGHRPRAQPISLPRISTGHFSGGRNLYFIPDRSGIQRSFSFYPRRAARTTDPAVVHLSATLTLVGTHRRHHDHPHSVSFALEGYYSNATSSAESELCMVGSGSYAREDGFGGVVLLPDVVLRLHVPRPSNLSRPFVTGRLEGAGFGAVTLVAYADSDYKYGEAASCPAPPAPVRLVRRKRFSCYRLKDLLRGSYSLEYGPGVHASSRSPLWLRHQHMHFNQMHCDSNGKLRAYMVFEGNTSSDPRLSNNTVQLMHGFLVGDEALVAEGFWDTPRSQLCLRACRVVRSGPSRADLAVRECGIGVSLWFPTVWSIRDRSVAAGMIWNTSRASDADTGKTSGVISVSRSASYRDNLSYIQYNYTRVEEAKKHCLSKPALSKERKGTFPGNYSYRDFAFLFYLKEHKIYGYASPVTIGSVVVQGDRLMAANAFYRNGTAEMKKERLLNVSYDLQYHTGYQNSSAKTISQLIPRLQRISAEGVYDTETGSLCMVACQLISNGSSDCEVLVTAQFAPVDAEARERVVGTISSLRKQGGDPLFFEPLDFVAEGMYAVKVAESISRTDMERIMLVISMTLPCVFTALQLLHVKKHPEALPAMSVTMLVILAVGYAVPLVLNIEAMFADTDSRTKLFVHLTSAGLLEPNEFMLRVSTMLAFVLQLRLLQLALSSRRPAEAGGKQEDSLPSDAERSTLWICLPLYSLGAVLVWIVNMSDGDMYSPWYRSRAIVDHLAAYVGLILDGFLLPQVVWNAFANSRVQALSPGFYAGGAVVRAAPHVYDVFWRQSYVSSWAPSYVYAGPGDLFGEAWDVAVPCGTALLAVLLFLQQRLGGAFLCGVRGRRPSEYQMVSTLSS